MKQNMKVNMNENMKAFIKYLIVVIMRVCHRHLPHQLVVPRDS